MAALMFYKTYAIWLQLTLQKTLAALRFANESERLLREVSKKSASRPKIANLVAAVEALSPTQFAERADKLADMGAKKIKK